MPEFNRTCPLCNADGVLRAVTAKGGRVTVTLGCDQCGHKWTTERKPEVQLFQGWDHVPLQTP